MRRVREAARAGRVHSILGQARARGGVVDHAEYVVFERDQALPIAAVTYRHAAACACCRCAGAGP